MRLFLTHLQLLNISGLLLATQAALILQPTHTPEQKRVGTLTHFTLHLLGTTALISGLIIIEINKRGPGHDHFTSAHAILGLTFYITLFLQAFVGFTQYFTPGLYGGVENAKKVYKYHRAAGYTIATLGLATVCAATWTDYNKGVLGIQHWAVMTAAVLVLVGVVPRVRPHKLGLKKEDGRVTL